MVHAHLTISVVPPQVSQKSRAAFGKTISLINQLGQISMSCSEDASAISKNHRAYWGKHQISWGDRGWIPDESLAVIHGDRTEPTIPDQPAISQQTIPNRCSTPLSSWKIKSFTSDSHAWKPVAFNYQHWEDLVGFQDLCWVETPEINDNKIQQLFTVMFFRKENWKSQACRFEPVDKSSWPNSP